MKFKINHTIEKEVEIEIPSYYQISCHTYKVVSESKAIAVCDLVGHQTIGEQSISALFCCGTPDKITADQFNDKLQTIINNLQSL